MANECITVTYEKDIHAAPRARKHIILMDGTWNDETGLRLDGLITNVARLKKIFISNERDQIVRYHRGVGNDNDNKRFGVIRGGISGSGSRAIVDKAYARFVQDWQPGDEIYIFGFSRGAAHARMLAAKINGHGIPQSITITISPVANREINVIEQRMTNIVIQPRAEKHFVPIEFLGVWDTVSAFGFWNVLRRAFFGRQKDLFTGNTIASNIRQAVHLVAIDETRRPFAPSLMNHEDKVHEVWFPGVHADIGGGYLEDSIAKVSLHYMLKQMNAYNDGKGRDAFKVDEKMRENYTNECAENWHFHLHGYGAMMDLRRIHVQVAGQPVPTSQLKPKVHRSYEWICKSADAYSVVERKEGGKKVMHYVPFQYMPYNFKRLGQHFEIVE